VQLEHTKSLLGPSQRKFHFALLPSPSPSSDAATAAAAVADVSLSLSPFLLLYSERS